LGGGGGGGVNPTGSATTPTTSATHKTLQRIKKGRCEQHTGRRAAHVLYAPFPHFGGGGGSSSSISGRIKRSYRWQGDYAHSDRHNHATPDEIS
jgi:hypothetical protein